MMDRFETNTDEKQGSTPSGGVGSLRNVGVLKKILDEKQNEVERLKSVYDLAELKRRAKDAPPAKDFVGALRTCPHAPVIAEVKRASPSAGSLKQEVSVSDLVRAYRKGGAAALSVITDGPFFNGSLDDLREARRTVALPILRKEFIIDSIQVYESRLFGADAMLLIAAGLDPVLLQDLYHEIRDFGMTPLIEVHGRGELEPVIDLHPPLIGINNRDLTTLEVSLDTCLNLLPLIPDDTLTVSESGIHSRRDIELLLDAGVDAFLIGTTLMRSDDPANALRELNGFTDGAA